MTISSLMAFADSVNAAIKNITLIRVLLTVECKPFVSGRIKQKIYGVVNGVNMTLNDIHC